MKMIIFVVVVLTALLASCCKEEKPICYLSTPVEPEMRDYIFDVGSYWIYKNDSTGTFDTITVLQVTDTVIRYMQPTELGSGFQYVRTRFKRSSNQKLFSERCTENFFQRTDDFDLGHSCQLDTLLLGTYCQQAVFKCYNEPYSVEIFAYIGFIPVINVEGVYYYNARKCWCKAADYTSSCSPYDLTTYYAPNNGLIKFTEKDSSGLIHSYSLIEKNITRYEINNPCNL